MDGSRLSEILQRVNAGNSDAWNELAPVIYGSLKRQASHLMRGQPPDFSLQTTSLVHELFLKLVSQQDQTWQNRQHFYSVCALVMRQILVDAARHRRALRRGGEVEVVPLESVDVAQPDRMAWEELDAALERLAVLHPRQAQIVDYRFFLGFQEAEIAELLQMSSKTVQRDWLAARAWLHQELSGIGNDS